MHHAATLSCTAVLLLGLAGCANKPPANDPDAVADYEQTNDPYEPANRFFFKVNDKLDTYALKPVAQGYVYVVPGVVRTGLHNALANYNAPVQFFNDVAQAKPRRAGDTFMRFVINSTIGGLGFFDVATKLGYKSHDGSGEVTLALWGVPQGPYLYLPFLGPTSPRGFGGFAIDQGVDPFNFVPRGHGLLTLNWATFGLGAIDGRANLLTDYDKVKQGALDPYATIRSLSRQHTQSVIDDARNDERATPPAWQ